MKFAVIGGDRRSVLLCRSLAGDGHRVHSFALEHAELPPEIPKAGCLQGCLYGADVAVLPTPAEKSGLLNAPYAAAPCRMDALIETLWPGQLLCGGLLGEERVLAAVKGGLTVRDFMKTPGFVTANAALTAEGAVALLLQESERALLGSRALVCGWGRIGRVLGARLRAMGAQVTA
ncbi:MAG: dipicolinate synthase, partial [Oscillospiraceae bacterium]|nr:dipicolinate synthase [Oscillospiraceae bacterium]